MSRPEVSEHQITVEWREARQMLNDARLSDYTLPQAIDILLGFRSNVIRSSGDTVIDIERWQQAKSKRNHPSQRRRADLSVAPEVTP